MNIDNVTLEKSLLNVIRKKYGDAVSEIVRLEAIQTILVEKVQEQQRLIEQLSKQKATQKPVAVGKTKSEDGGTF